jgi:arginine decarboxylase
VTKIPLPEWTAAQSADIYGINDWGAGYFSVRDNGEVVITAQGENGQVSLSILDLVNEMKERGMDMPVLVRIENLLAQQIARLNNAFNYAIAQSGYQGKYRGVFPVKVNQQCHVIEEIAHVGAKFGHGLEAGSKPELIIALAYLESPDACIVCNGYKDEDLSISACKPAKWVTAHFL